jgi:quercetin 2,3-dioxygenase
VITRRPADERGHANHGWLDARHTFSFAGYRDPTHDHFRDLRVMNEDHIAAGRGFPTHPHENMEILTYVLEGELEHRDSMGNGATIRPGTIQTMSAGTGIMHSEANPSQDNPIHLYQIWIIPEAQGLKPSYGEYTFDTDARKGRLQLIASRDGRENSAKINQEISLYTTLLDKGQSVTYSLASGRYAWVQVARGSITLNGESYDTGDGAAISEESALTLTGQETAEVLLFDLA